MARHGPSFTALVGLLAVAGYQNCDCTAGSSQRKPVELTGETPHGRISFVDEARDYV